MQITDEKITAILRQQGYKITPQRKAVIEVISRLQVHLAPVDIFTRVHRDYPEVGRVTVYRTLNILDSLGLLCHLHTQDRSQQLLLRRPAGHHHHLVCSGCGKVVDFDNCSLDKLVAQLEGDSGFKIEGHILELYGLCRQCRVAGSPMPEVRFNEVNS